MNNTEFAFYATLWFALALLFGYFGSKRPIGFLWAFFLALLISPIAALLGILLFRKRRQLEIVFPELEKTKSSEQTTKLGEPKN